jgi:hypothetical protein
MLQVQQNTRLQHATNHQQQLQTPVWDALYSDWASSKGLLQPPQPNPPGQQQMPEHDRQAESPRDAWAALYSDWAHHNLQAQPNLEQQRLQQPWQQQECQQQARQQQESQQQQQQQLQLQQQLLSHQTLQQQHDGQQLQLQPQQQAPGADPWEQLYNQFYAAVVSSPSEQDLSMPSSPQNLPLLDGPTAAGQQMAHTGAAEPASRSSGADRMRRTRQKKRIEQVSNMNDAVVCWAAAQRRHISLQCVACCRSCA